MQSSAESVRTRGKRQGGGPSLCSRRERLRTNTLSLTTMYFWVGNLKTLSRVKYCHRLLKGFSIGPMRAGVLGKGKVALSQGDKARPNALTELTTDNLLSGILRSCAVRDFQLIMRAQGFSANRLH